MEYEPGAYIGWVSPTPLLLVVARDDHLTVACGQGAIRLLELQRAGKAPMKAAEFLRGTPLKPGARFA